jgi:hypothetical protein
MGRGLFCNVTAPGLISPKECSAFDVPTRSKSSESATVNRLEGAAA